MGGLARKATAGPRNRRRGGRSGLQRVDVGGRAGSLSPGAWRPPASRSAWLPRAPAEPRAASSPRAARARQPRSPRPCPRGPVPSEPLPPELGARLASGQAPASCWPPGLSWGRPPGRGLGGRGPGRGSLRSLARCPLRRSLARRPRSALPPGRSRDAAGAAKARRRLGLGRASHWPAPRVTRPAPPRPRPDHAPDTPPPLQPPAPRRAQSPGAAGAVRSQIWRPTRPPAAHPLPPRPRGSASQARSPGEDVRRALGPMKGAERVPPSCPPTGDMAGGVSCATPCPPRAIRSPGAAG
nr:basic proline-rich protein-like [Marmota flaviventris]